MGVIYHLPKSIDDLDAAVFRSIPDYSPYVVEFKREEIPPSLVVYRLWCKELDDLGEITLGEVKLDRVDAQHSTLETEPPPALWEPDRKDERYQSIKGHYDAVMEAFFNRLERDPVWGDGGMWAAIQKRVPIVVAEPPQANEDKPWERIPEKGWDRMALKLWHEGYEAKDIGLQLNKKGKTITNRMCVLRKRHGEEVVPKRK